MESGYRQASCGNRQQFSGSVFAVSIPLRTRKFAVGTSERMLLWSPSRAWNEFQIRESTSPIRMQGEVNTALAGMPNILGLGECGGMTQCRRIATSDLHRRDAVCRGSAAQYGFLSGMRSRFSTGLFHHQPLVAKLSRSSTGNHFQV